MPKQRPEDQYVETLRDTELLDLIRSAPDLSDVSKKRYTANLKLMARVSGQELDWVLRNAHPALDALYVYLTRREAPEMGLAHAHTETISTKNKKNKGGVEDPPHPSISARPPATVRSYCAAVWALFKRMSPEELSDISASELRAWRKCNEDAMKLVRDKYDNWVASDRQRNNFVPWEDIVAKRDELGSNPETYATRPHLLLSLLTYLPPMRTSDLGSLRVMECPRTAQAKTGKRGEMLRSWNYVVLCKTKGTITINEYKTARHYQRLENKKKERERERQSKPWSYQAPKPPSADAKYYDDDAKAERSGELPLELFRVLKTSVARQPRSWVFVERRGEPYQDASFNKMVSLELAALFDGKAMSVNLVRHAAAMWLDQHHRHNADMLRYFRYWMMHSRAMQSEYVLANNMQINMQNINMPAVEAAAASSSKK